MKITPMASAAVTAGVMPAGGDEPQGTRMRSLKMSTNATPGVAPPAEGETPSLSANSEGAPEASADNQPLGPQYVALAKQRRSLQKERQAFEKEKADLVARGATPADAVAIADLKRNPLGMLRKAGLTLEDLTQAVVNDRGDDQSYAEINALKAEIAALKEGVDKRFTDARTQEEQQALAQMKREATNLVAQSGETYELVRETGGIPIVMNLIERTYRKSGEVLQVSEALQLVEEELLADFQKRAALKKVQATFAPPPAPAPQSRHPMRTITNRDAASPPLDRRSRALAAFQGTLKK
jgi:hypothetical protein